MLYPETFEEVLAVHDKLTVWVGAAVPVPVAESVVVEGDALLVKVRVAVSEPVISGLKVTVNDALCPAGMVAGSDKPLIANNELFELAPVTVTLAPLAVRIPVAVPLVPSTTLPTAMVEVALSCPVVTVPVPDRGIVSVGLEPVEVTVTLPLTLPAETGANVTLKVALCPEESVAGVEIPLTEKPDPLLATFEIVSVDPPVFVTVSDNTCFVPSGTDPKLKLAGFAPSAPGATPVPDNGTDNVGFVALEVMVTLPLALPAVTGANVTLKVALCPAVRVAGVEIPLTEKPDPLLATFEIVSVVPPVLVTVSDSTCLLPSVTLPKLKLVGFDPREPAAMPVPDSGTESVGLEPFEVMVTLPLALPAETGANVTLKVALCPAVSVAGVEIPLTEKPDPLLATFETVRVEPPVLVMVSVSTCLLPSVTLPKFKLVGFAPSAPCVTPVPDNGRDSEEFGASEVIVTLPLALPAAWGAKVAVNVVLCEALRASGVVMPLILNPVPLTAACEILTVAPVSLVSVMV
jgi:hypothetical protein